MFFSLKYFSFLLLLILLFCPWPCFPVRTTPEFEQTLLPVVRNVTWGGFMRFLDAEKGSNVMGMSELKKYFHRFGYLPNLDTNFTDMFDKNFEMALAQYQAKLGLPVTSKLDSTTLEQIMLPRCGLRDTNHDILRTTKHFAYFPGKPRWEKLTPSTLTYALSPEKTVKYLKRSDIKAAVERAFAQWASVIPINFMETEDYSKADIKIGFYNGDHGDGDPFDGVLGVLAHAFSPESGRFHLDASETWAVDFKSEKSKVAIDLQSVALHEIGHILGLAHSSVKEAVMYPSLSPRSKKVLLKLDDVKGVQALYGSNPNFTFSSLLKSNIESNKANHLGPQWSKWVPIVLALILYLYK